MLTLRRTQSENGKVTMTISQEMQKRTQPRNPSPDWRDCFNEEAKKRNCYAKLGEFNERTLEAFM